MGQQMATENQADFQAVSRMAQIVGLFGLDSPEVTVSEATQRLSLNRTTVHRYLSSMATAGLLSPGSRPSAYAPGGLLLQLGAFAIGQRRIIQTAPAYLQELSQQTGVTAVLSLWAQSGPVVSMVEEDPSHNAIVTVRVGSQLPLDSSQAIAFLTYLPDQLRVDRLLGSIPKAQRDNLHERIAQTRQSGISMHVGNPRGISVFSAPVFGESGVCATIAAVGTDRMLSPADSDSSAATAVKKVAAALSAQMAGHIPET